MHKKTALKWKPKKQKEEESPTAVNFKTHQRSESEEQIIIPKQYPEFNKNKQLLIIECGKEKLIVQIASPNNYATHHAKVQEKSEISVLKTLLDFQGIQCGSTGTFKGEIRILNQNKIQQHSLQIVQFLIRDTYFSRRDQYKVMKALQLSFTHVYLRKKLCFDEIQIQVYSMMRNNQQLVKTGIIDKNTKIIFRSNCCKLTVAIELSIESFQLNQNKQLYLEKMIEFLYIFLKRNTYFGNTHRLTLIFYGRCYYPRFKTLKQAYDYLIKENTHLSDQDKFQINFSAALQKDYKGRIYQDVYRRIIWSSDMIDNFRQFFWEKISELLFTINWDTSHCENHIGKFITKSLQQKINTTNIKQGLSLGDINKSDLKIKPFLHKMKSTLSHSKDSNLFEAISLISQQYRHHYKFRSLSETGNNILILTAGCSEYDVDELSYKMAKSYVYLTNISCSLINFNKKMDDPLRANIVSFNKKPLYRSQDCKKLQNLQLNCIEKQVYNSPFNEDMQFWDNFQLKNMIYPQQIIQMSPQKSQQAKRDHHCKIDNHYELKESIVLNSSSDLIIKQKIVSFISVYNMSDRCLYIHEQLYDDKLKINRLNFSKVNQKYKLKDIDIFEIDLDKIIIGRRQWNFSQSKNNITTQIEAYQFYLDKSRNYNKQDRLRELQKVNRIIFKNYNEIEVLKQSSHKIQTMSNDQCNPPPDILSMKKRKQSQSYMSEFVDFDMIEPQKGKINIFEATFRNKNHQYTAGQRNQNKQKKYSTHNKERRKNLFFESNIHYLMPHFNELILKKFKAFMKKEYIEQMKYQQQKINSLFEMQKMWKNICFPLLTPIYTKYKQNFQNAQEHLDEGVINESNDKNASILQDEICKLLMKNYQIQQIDSQYHNQITKMSKGQVSCLLKMHGQNLFRSHIIDKQRQQRIVPFLLYRYLSYEDKDCRFCAKYVYFQDKNYYDFSKRKDLQTKTVKIVLAYQDGEHAKQSQLLKEDSLAGSFNSSKKERDPFVGFIREFNKRYKQFNIDLIGKIKPLQIPKKKKVQINFSRQQSRSLYHHQQIQIEINLQYNYSSLFEILVSWNLCSSVIVRQFVDKINTMAIRNRLKPFLVTAGNIFNTVWSITTIGEIIFEHKISLDLLESNIIGSGEWLWDSNDYFLHISGISFIQFKKDKKMILWRDNNNVKRGIDITKDDSSRQYNKFFMKSAVFDFIGGIINRVIKDVEICGKFNP